MHVRKISEKGQITIPKDIRSAIGIKPGDLIAYELRGETVKLRRVKPFESLFHPAISETLEEWNSPEDEEAFNDL
jgi:AbrB family looped-hinge helix DNA binding protein